MGVNSMGILLIKPDDKFILFEFTYSEIESLLLDPSDNFITLNLARGPQERQRVYVFETKQKAAIGALVASYYPSIANWIREADAPKRKVKQVRMKMYRHIVIHINRSMIISLKFSDFVIFIQITNEDRLRLHQNLVNCRRNLIDSNSLKKPLDDGAGGQNFFKNTLRKMSGKKLDKYRAEALANEQGETYNGHSHAYWAFCKVALAQTLLYMNELDEMQALEVFNLILTYAGLVQTNKGRHISVKLNLKECLKLLF